MPTLTSAGNTDEIDPRGSQVSGEVSTMAAEYTVSGGEIAALIAAIAFLILCLAASWLLAARIGKAVKSATTAIEDVNAKAGVMLNNVNTTVEHVNVVLVKSHTSLDEVNHQLERVDTMTAHAQQVTGNVANLTTLVGAAATSPLVKLASFGFGLRRAAAKRRRDETESDVREVLAAKKKKSRGKRVRRNGQG